MNIDTSHVSSPLRLVKVGLLSLSEERVVLAGDPVALALLGHPAETKLDPRHLVDWARPADAADVEASAREEPFTYLGLSNTGTALMVHVSRLAGGPLVASLTSINEYLAEAQALARIQLRNTVDSIISGFAHEVRNPIAAILSLSEAALLTAPHDSVLVRIPSLVARVESLIQQSLAYSRPKPPKRSLHHTSFLIEHAITLLRPRDTPVRLQLPPSNIEVPPVMVDLLQSEQVLVNLIENALDAAASVVKLEVRPGKTSVPSVCIQVSDDGPGIPPETAERIFDPFFTTKAHGTGLGLAIARDLARLNGGELRHVVNAERGAIFRVYLPSTPAPIRGQW